MKDQRMDKVSVNNYEDLKKELDSKQGQYSKIFILFSGSRTGPNGQSWCPDCVKADPVIEEVVQVFNKEKALLVTAFVGARDEWKNPENRFRKSEFAVKSIPTLIKYKTSTRLEESQCADKGLVKTFFEE